ncbi:MAG: hypothetical protein IJQ93_01045 [Bacteroidales bacterium]|nr:hypothetical protein [Bacteroidales bacterium]
MTRQKGNFSSAGKKAYWNESRGLFADRAEQDNYSQHGNALAILCGIVDNPQVLAQKLLTDSSLNQCTLYYKFYLYQALVKAGLGDHIKPHLGELKEVGGTIPHPSGSICVQYKMKGKKLQAEITLPEGIDGSFIWKGQVNTLHSGKNSLRL